MAHAASCPRRLDRTRAPLRSLSPVFGGPTEVDRHDAKLAASLLVGGVCLPMPAIASADAGIPMIFLVWPGFWILLVPTIGLEALVARRVLAVEWPRALRLSARANLISTFIGVPLTWLAMLALEALAASGLWYGSKAVGLTEPPEWSTYLLLPFAGAWVGGDDPWVVPAAAAWLGVFFFFVSVWVEARVVSRMSVKPSAALRWSWQANALSYAVIAALMLAFLVWSLLVR